MFIHRPFGFIKQKTGLMLEMTYDLKSWSSLQRFAFINQIIVKLLTKT